MHWSSAKGDWFPDKTAAAAASPAPRCTAVDLLKSVRVPYSFPKLRAVSRLNRKGFGAGLVVGLGDEETETKNAVGNLKMQHWHRLEMRLAGCEKCTQTHGFPAARVNIWDSQLPTCV